MAESESNKTDAIIDENIECTKTLFDETMEDYFEMKRNQFWITKEKDLNAQQERHIANQELQRNDMEVLQKTIRRSSDGSKFRATGFFDNNFRELNNDLKKIDEELKNVEKDLNELKIFQETGEGKFAEEAISHAMKACVEFKAEINSGWDKLLEAKRMQYQAASVERSGETEGGMTNKVAGEDVLSKAVGEDDVANKAAGEDDVAKTTTGEKEAKTTTGGIETNRAAGEKVASKAMGGEINEGGNNDNKNANDNQNARDNDTTSDDELKEGSRVDAISAGKTWQATIIRPHEKKNGEAGFMIRYDGAKKSSESWVEASKVSKAKEEFSGGQGGKAPSATVQTPTAMINKAVAGEDVVLSLRDPTVKGWTNQETEYKSIMFEHFRKVGAGNTVEAETATEVHRLLMKRKGENGKFIKLTRQADERIEIGDDAAFTKIKQDFRHRMKSSKQWLVREKDLPTSSDTKPAAEENAAVANNVAGSAGGGEKRKGSPSIEETGSGVGKKPKANSTSKNLGFSIGTGGAKSNTEKKKQPARRVVRARFQH